MKVLVIGWEFPPSKTGGLGTHCYELVKNLGEKGVGVLLLVPKRSKGAEKGLKNVEVIEVGGKIPCPYNNTQAGREIIRQKFSPPSLSAPSLFYHHGAGFLSTRHSRPANQTPHLHAS